MCICVCAKPWRWCRSNSVFISFYLNSTRLPHAFEQLSLLEERKKEGGLPPPPNSISFWVSILPEFFNYEKRIFVLYYSKQDENILLIWDVLLGMIWGGDTLRGIFLPPQPNQFRNSFSACDGFAVFTPQLLI